MKTLWIALLMVFNLCVNAQTSDKDKTFIDDAFQSGLLEVKSGELAQARATNCEVKEIGQQMIADHSKANSQLTALAARNNIITPVILNDKGQKIYDMLAEKKGDDFNTTYLDYIVSAHKRDLQTYKKEAKKGDDIDLKGFASSKLTVLKHHRQMAKKLRKSIK